MGAFEKLLKKSSSGVYAPSVRSADERISNIVKEDAAAVSQGDFVLVGFPQDEGVKRNGGRVGAVEGPDAIRRMLGRMVAPVEFIEGEKNLVDVGNLECGEDLEESQELLAEVVSSLLKRGAFPVVLGGGHETSYGHFLGYVKAEQPTVALNIDAHFDLRPLEDGRAHSGSPFRQMLSHESKLCKAYRCYGIQPSANSPELFDYAYANEVRYELAHTDNLEAMRLFFQETLQEAEDKQSKILLSLDLDSVCQSDAPGVSAPQPVGLSAKEIISFAVYAKSHPQISSIDVAELNPSLDSDSQTARLAARYIWEFLV